MIRHIVTPDNFEIVLFVAFGLMLVALVDCFFQQRLIEVIAIFTFPGPINFDFLQGSQNLND